MNDTLTLNLVQMASTAAWNDNRRTVTDRLAEASGRCDLAVFPENVLCLGRGTTIRGQARPLSELCTELGGLCRTAGLAAVFGGVPLAEDGQVMNSSLAFASDGTLLARYDKMHLFQFNLGRPGGIDETTTYGYGASPVAFDFQGWRIALSICYDLRFPELYRALGELDLLLCTAAFTRRTGLAHWEVLLRARAIENLCYAAGAGQCGVNPETGTELFGHTLVVDPWGEVAGGLESTDAGTLVSACRKARIEAVRATMPALEHRRLGVALTQAAAAPTPGKAAGAQICPARSAT
jgi:deaminated glutathione amidase